MSTDASQQITRALKGAGADLAACRVTASHKHELNAEWDEVSLLRSMVDRGLRLEAHVGGRKAVLGSNATEAAEIDRSVHEVVAQAKASRVDDANDLAPRAPPASFESGPTTPDLDAMHDRLDEFLAWRRKEHPKVSLRAARIEFERTETALTNSNGVDFESHVGVYRFMAMFSARSGADVSSFNYSSWMGRTLDRPMSALSSFDRLLGQAADQLVTARVDEKFVGDVIVTPDCLDSFLTPVTDALRDGALIGGTSMFRDALGKQIADHRLTIHARPISACAEPSFFTSDGHATADTTIFDRGVLRTFLLSRYGANKTGRTRAANDGGGWTVEPGETPFASLVGDIERGVLLCRFSGGRPSDNGDFSGIAKNSYLIENGKVTKPLRETMVSGNLLHLLKAVRGVSREVVNFGDESFPWLRFGGVTVS